MRAAAIAIALAAAACAHAQLVEPRPAADFVRDTHAMLEAFDRGDAAAVAAITAPSFVRFEAGKVHERAAELARLKPRPPDIARTWKDEHVYIGGNDATFIGLAAEHELGNDSHGNREYDGWYTVAWTRAGATWKVAHWTWQPYRSALDFQREQWNDNFRQDVGFTHDPNQLLVTATAGVAPGAALDLATGQGRNALHLARAGWAVTAVDISDEGLRRAREAASRAHVALDTVQADIDAYDYGVAKWDLITEIYVPNPVARAAKIKAGLRPGGLFVLEFFLDEGDGGVKPAELRAQFADGFDILRDEVVEDRPDWGQDRAKLVRFVARKR
jgi:SAM-dependent methyltransferase